MTKKKPAKKRKPKHEAVPPSFRDKMILKSMIRKGTLPLVYKHTDRAIRQVDAAQRTVTFIASVEQLDLDGDLILVRGIDTSYFERRGTFLKDHQKDKPIGRVTALRIESLREGDALVGDAVLLPPGISADADQAWGEIVHKVRTGISIGFLPVDPENPRDGEPTGAGGVVRRKILLLEISSVTLPSCPSCSIIAAGEQVRRWPDTVDQLIAAIDGALIVAKALERREARERADDNFERALQRLQTLITLYGWDE